MNNWEIRMANRRDADWWQVEGRVEWQRCGGVAGGGVMQLHAKSGKLRVGYFCGSNSLVGRGYGGGATKPVNDIQRVVSPLFHPPNQRTTVRHDCFCGTLGDWDRLGGNDCVNIKTLSAVSHPHTCRISTRAKISKSGISCYLQSVKSFYHFSSIHLPPWREQQRKPRHCRAPKVETEENNRLGDSGGWGWRWGGSFLCKENKTGRDGKEKEGLVFA